LFALLACYDSVAAGICREIIVSNEATRDLAIIDPDALKVIGRVPLRMAPRGMALSPDREQLFVALSGSSIAGPGVDQSTLPAPDKVADGIGVIDLATRRLVRTIKGVSDPTRVAVSADGKKLFAASGDRGMLVMFDLESGAALTRTPVGADAEGVDLSPSGSRIYVTSEAENRVSVLDTRSAAVLVRFAVGVQPRATSFSPNGLRAYVANGASANISVIDTASLRKLRSIAMPDGMMPMHTAVSPEGAPLYVSTGRGREILAIDPDSGLVTARAESGARPRDLALRPDGRELYVVNGPSNDLSVFTLPVLKLRKKIHTGGNPWGVVCRDNWWTREALGMPASVVR
jgi:YVTN family beta-propeller protein